MATECAKRLSLLAASVQQTNQALLVINRDLHDLLSIVTLQDEKIEEHDGLIKRQSDDINDLREEVKRLSNYGLTNSSPDTFGPPPLQSHAYNPGTQSVQSLTYITNLQVSGDGCPLCLLPRAANSRSQFVDKQICKVCWQWTYSFFKQREGRQQMSIMEEYKTALPAYLVKARIRYNNAHGRLD